MGACNGGVWWPRVVGARCCGVAWHSVACRGLSWWSWGRGVVACRGGVLLWRGVAWRGMSWHVVVVVGAWRGGLSSWRVIVAWRGVAWRVVVACRGGAEKAVADVRAGGPRLRLLWTC